MVACEGVSDGGGAAWGGSTGIIYDKSEEMRNKESSYARWNPVEKGSYYTVYGAEDVEGTGLPLRLA